MSDRARVEARQTRIAEDTAQVIDYVSRILQGVQTGNWYYVGDKIGGLRGVLDRLERDVDIRRHAEELRQIRGEAVWVQVAGYARHLWVGRAIFSGNHQGGEAL